MWAFSFDVFILCFDHCLGSTKLLGKILASRQTTSLIGNIDYIVAVKECNARLIHAFHYINVTIIFSTFCLKFSSHIMLNRFECGQLISLVKLENPHCHDCSDHGYRYSKPGAHGSIYTPSKHYQPK